MFKEGANVKSWKRRYFVLYDKHMDYYENPKTDKSPKGSIELGTCTVTPIKVRTKVSKVSAFICLSVNS